MYAVEWFDHDFLLSDYSADPQSDDFLIEPDDHNEVFVLALLFGDGKDFLRTDQRVNRTTQVDNWFVAEL